jgi:formylglycine-generating enzyme required for sulfatase activity
MWLLLKLASFAALSCALVLAISGESKQERQERILRQFVGEFVAIKPGDGTFPASFTMGSKNGGSKEEKPAHDVRLKRPFALAKYEVTQELYELVVGVNPSRWKGARNSVEMVNWSEAGEFCQRATSLLRELKFLDDREVMRLPAEAEWEYACRAGTSTRYSFGDGEDALKDFGWYRANSKGEDPPVGRKRPNAWGLYDMHGYVWEWCQDGWHPTYDGAPTDGSAWEAAGDKERIIRGGSWADSADTCRSAYRHHAPADHRSDTIGFRCVRAAVNR